ncbi:MAG: hypothetical protein ACREN5_01555 [Gemmatimonadales bacterium]
MPILLALVAGVAGLAIGVCAFVAPGEGPLGAALDRLGGVDTRVVPGDARRFDPFGALPEVAEYAGGGAKLVSIEVALVRADGTMDLKADYKPSPHVTYRFVREVERPDDAPPPGAGGANTGPWYQPVQVEASEPGQRRRRTRVGAGGSSVVDYVNKGMERTTSTVVSGEQRIVELPGCSIADMFRLAIERGAPADAVAHVTYDRHGYGLRITGLDADGVRP